MRKLSLEEIKKIEFSMLKQFADFCDNHNLHYVLAYGTMIGAVRHNGFIPWDDDVDVLMPRKDYNKLVRFYRNGKQIGNMNLLYATNDNKYYYPFAKLSDPNTVAKMESNLTEHGVWIDVFPVDKVPKNDKETLKFQKKMMMLRRIVVSMTTDFKNRKIDIKTIPKLILMLFACVVGKKRITYIMNKEAQKYNKTDSNRLCAIAFQAAPGGIISESELYDCIIVPFESSGFKVPRNYDEYLKHLYGDYMVLPPENKRTTHGLQVYSK